MFDAKLLDIFKKYLRLCLLVTAVPKLLQPNVKVTKSIFLLPLCYHFTVFTKSTLSNV
jgi:hypothetical protein